jgi:hypothetical protein
MSGVAPFTLLMASAFVLFQGVAHGAGQIPEEVTHVRDPFKKPMIAKVGVKPRSELESFPVEKFKLIGIVTGPKRLRAMLQGPTGTSYFVAEGMAIGMRKGVIRKITTEAVLVRERVVNILGQEENVETELHLPEEGKNLGGNGDKPTRDAGEQKAMPMPGGGGV